MLNPLVLFECSWNSGQAFFLCCWLEALRPAAVESPAGWICPSLLDAVQPVWLSCAFCMRNASNLRSPLIRRCCWQKHVPRRALWSSRPPCPAAPDRFHLRGSRSSRLVPSPSSAVKQHHTPHSSSLISLPRETLRPLGSKYVTTAHTYLHAVPCTRLKYVSPLGRLICSKACGH